MDNIPTLLNAKVLVRPIQPSEYKNGIIIPVMAQEKAQEGIVITTGPGRILENGNRLQVSVHPGDRVLFGKYSYTEIKIEGEDYLIVEEDHIHLIY